MGTSSNKASPHTPNWNIPRAVLGRTDVNPNQQNQELWKAALADRSGILRNELSDPVIADLCRAAGNIKSPVDAISNYEHLVSESGRANLIFDIAKRAFVRAVALKSGSSGFASELFSEVVSYYASRDLPSLIGTKDHIPKPIDSIKLKRALRERTKLFALSTTMQTDKRGWSIYINEVINQIIRVGVDK